jgi:hypothetical protein
VGGWAVVKPFRGKIALKDLFEVGESLPSGSLLLSSFLEKKFFFSKKKQTSGSARRRTDTAS